LSRFVEVPVSSGGSVTVEIDEGPAGGRTMRGGGSGGTELVERSTQTLEDSLGGLGSALRHIVADLHHAREVERIDVELGLKLTGEAGFVVAKCGGEANFRVRVRWTRTGANSDGGGGE
jgi:hypothetical protein